MKTKASKKKAIETGKAIALADAIEYAAGSVVSKTLIDKKSGSLTLFAFDKGEGLSEHTSPYDAVVQILEGQAELVIAGQSVKAEAGELVIMPARPSAVFSATLPTKPSQTTRSVVPLKMSLPSTLPWKLMWPAAETARSSSPARLIVSLPLITSSPMLSRPTVGASLP